MTNPIRLLKFFCLIFSSLIVPARGQSPAPDIIFHNGIVLTVEESQPEAQAIAVKGDSILAIGNNEDILGLQDMQTRVIDLEGKTLMPGFVDPHTHLLNDAASQGMSLEEAQQMALENGITTLGSMFVTSDFLEEMEIFAQASKLRVRTSLYMVYTDNCGGIVGDWYKDHPPTRERGEMLRIGGIKIFTDGGSCGLPALSFEYPAGGHGDLFLTQTELNNVVTEAHTAGYQVAIHAIGDLGIEQAQNAIELALAGGPNTPRHRIEHNSFVRPDLLPRYSEIGIVPVIFGDFPTCVEGSIASFYGTEGLFWLENWRTFLDANPELHIAWKSDYPYFTTNPMIHLYSYVTRKAVDEDGSICEPPDWLASGKITVQEALPLMTINGAYTLFRDEEAGSLKPGKFADLIVLSDNPLTVDPDAIKDIRVLMTMVGGQVEYCAPGSERFCTGFSQQNLALGKPVTASNALSTDPPEFAVDGDLETLWNAGDDPTQWIEVDLLTPVDIDRINLIISQYPGGETTHKIWGKSSGDQYQLLHEFNEETNDNEELTITPLSPWVNIEYIKIETTKSPSWVAWREVQVFGVAYQNEFIQVADDNWHFETAATHRYFIPFGVNYYDPATYQVSTHHAFDVIGAFDSVAVDRQLGKIRNLGANIFRIFLSVVSFEPDLYVLNESNFQKLDKLIEIAKKHHLRIIFDLINEWEGNPAWESWDYYADETTLLGYEFYLEAMGARYAEEPTIFSWSLKNEPYVRGPGSGIMADLWIPYAQFKYGSDANLTLAWGDYPRSGESWDQIKQPDPDEYDPLNTPGNQRLYDYQLFREDIAYNWVRRLSKALRRNDPNHMVSIGLDQHSVPIKNAVPERTYTGFNPRKIAHFLDYTSIHTYNWWDAATVSTFIEAIARYSFANKPVVVEEFNHQEIGSAFSLLLDSSSGWLHWGTFAVSGFESDSLFDSGENVTALGNTFRSIAETIYNSIPIRAPDVARLNIDLKQALTSVVYQDTRFPEYVSLFNSSGGPVGFNVSNYRPPLRLGMPPLEMPDELVLGQQYNITWRRLNWPIMLQTSVSLLISRDGGDQWETIVDDIEEDEYFWTVTEPISDNCVFRVVDKSDADIYAESPATYSIVNPTSIEQNGENQPLKFQLSSAYPNPFNPTTTISFTIPSSSDVTLKVYNMHGQEVKTLIDKMLLPGTYSVTWNSVNNSELHVASGIYLYRITTSEFQETKKLLLLK